MPRKHLRRWLPDQATLQRNAFLRYCAPWLQQPNLWHLNRHSVAGGLALGLACGLVPGPLQVISATLCAIVFRVNLPVAIFATFYTNPLTIVPIYLAAYSLGSWLTGQPGLSNLPPAPETNWSALWHTLQAWLDWMSALGWPLLIGLLSLAALLALGGFIAVQLCWRGYIVLALRQRRKRRAA